MTKKRYRNTPRVSRSSPVEGNQARTIAPSPGRKHSPRRGRPFGRHFDALQPESEPHPIDTIVDAAAEVVAARSQLRRLANAVMKSTADRRLFISYDDRRNLHASRRESLFYDAGFECGQDDARAESLRANATRSRAARALARQVRLALLKAALPRRDGAALLLELARGLVLGLPARRPARASRGSIARRALGEGKR